MIPSDMPCPVCKRKDSLVSSGTEIGWNGGKFRSRHYECACGCTWVMPPKIPVLADSLERYVDQITSGRATQPHDETCVKCGSGNPNVEWLGAMRLDQYTTAIDMVKAGLNLLRLTCHCGYSWERKPLDAKQPAPSPADDPLQANVTLGVLKDMLKAGEESMRKWVIDRERRGGGVVPTDFAHVEGFQDVEAWRGRPEGTD